MTRTNRIMSYWAVLGLIVYWLLACRPAPTKHASNYTDAVVMTSYADRFIDDSLGVACYRYSATGISCVVLPK